MKINSGMLLALVIHILITITLFLNPDHYYMGFLGLAIVLAIITNN